MNAEDPSEVFIENTPATPLFVPLGLASDGDTLYVGDWATGIVWAISDAGTARDRMIVMASRNSRLA